MQDQPATSGPAPVPNPNNLGAAQPVPNAQNVQATAQASLQNPTTVPYGSMIESTAAQQFGPSAPGATPNFGRSMVTSMPTPTPVPMPKKSHRSLIETIILVIVSIIAVTFIGLFVWKYIEWDAVKTDVDGQIDSAVAMAVAENTTKLENEFLDREKYPYKSFMGPSDYGSLSFEYPKTWNVYIAKDAATGGDFEAYLNPGEVQPVSTRTINALRVTVKDQAFDVATRTYENYVKSGKLSIVTRTVGSAIANVYSGELPNGIQGIVAMFKLRDKTVILQTDALIFSDEFYRLLDTVTFIE